MARSARTALPLPRRLLLAAILALAATLAVGASRAWAASSASDALGPSPASTPVAFPAAVEEEWEEEDGEWEVEDDEEEWKVGEEEEVGGESGSGAESGAWREVPESCPLYQANARVVVSEGSDEVNLLVDYELEKPTKVTVEYWLKGSHGALQLKPLQRRMSRHGSLRGVERLSAREMSKVQAARAFVVDLEMAGMPSRCERYCTHHLTSSQQRGDRTVWSEPARRSQGH